MFDVKQCSVDLQAAGSLFLSITLAEICCALNLPNLMFSCISLTLLYKNNCFREIKNFDLSLSLLLDPSARSLAFTHSGSYFVHNQFTVLIIKHVCVCVLQQCNGP